MEKLCKNGVKLGVLAAVALLVAVTVAFGFGIPGLSKFENEKPVNGVVSVPVAKVSDGKAHYFRLADGGKDLNFFIVKGKDGALHTAFDACDVCYKGKLGYVQDGDKMVCKKCNQKFPIAKIGAESEGGCNPSYLPAKIDAATVHIKVADLKSGDRLF
jgi:uncharacterized membrane protein